ncbi:hypothetical protein CANMA_002807 [Candida margitis]|uniref:uncharacterized protein n=1 Tax=Candida margitis TaxID=1775924 RepID=UPI0022279325|nr:uncharacterized protein CANMA_002807 [Candida margitis]KAI5967627.1 hypothetical protein CANMA_002807 [Candida margitis]
MEPSSEGFTGNLGYKELDVTLNYFTNQPDVSSVSNAELAIIFKSLSKKDPKTKEKALNDLLSVIEKESINFDDLAVICWVKLYPKIALDNFKDVRIMTHQIQGTLLKVLGSKRYGKYLKITMPIWLMGVKDPDKNVARTATRLLLDNFQGDETKFEKVWEIFEDQILNLIGSVVTIETPETLSDPRYVSESEIQIKYDRVLMVCIEMLLQVFKGSSQSVSSIESILVSEVIWERLIYSVKEDSMNLALFKCILTLILSVFSKENHLLESMDYKPLYKTVSKAIMKVKFGKSKPGIIYSTVILPFWQVLIQLARFSKRNELSKSIWDMGGSKSITRLHSYIRLGPCDSDPIYYDFVAVVMNDLKQGSSKIIDFNDTEEASFFTKTFMEQFEKVRENFKSSCLRCAVRVLDLFDVDKVENMTTIIRSVLNGKKIRLQSNIKEMNSSFQDFKNKPLLKECLTKVQEEIKRHLGDEIYTESYLIRFNELLKASDLKDEGIDMIEYAIEQFNTQQVDANTVTRCVIAYLAVNDDITPPLKTFIKQLPEHLEGINDTSTQLLKDVVSKKILADEDLIPLINQSFANISLINPDNRDGFIKLLGLDFGESEYPEIYSYLRESSRGSAEPEYLEKLLTSRDEKALREVIANLNEQSCLAFISAVAKTSSLAFVIELGIDNVIRSAWSNVKPSVQFLRALRQFEDVYSKSLVDYLKNCSIETNFDDIAEVVKEGPLPYDLFERELKESINQIEPFEIAIANALESAVYLCKYGSKRMSSDVPVLAKFIIQLDDAEPKWQVLTLVAKEIVSDYIITSEITIEEESILMEIVGNFSHRKCTENIEELINDVNGNDPLALATNGDDIYSFYASRVLSKIVENASECMSTSQFESLKINYVQLLKHPLKCVAFTSGIKNFLGSSTLDRARNYAFSEILAVKAEKDITTIGLKWITMLISFLNQEADLKNVFPGVKLSMVLKQIDDWFDSSIAYDPGFIDMRIQALIFLGRLVVIEETLPDIYYDLVNKIIGDNLDMADDRVDLKYYTLKVYANILKYNPSDGLELQDERMIELLTTTTDDNPNQVASLVESVLERALQLSNISTNLIKNSRDQFLKVLSKSGSITKQTRSTYYLEKLFKEEKDDFVIEYQLSKDENKKAELPPTLMEIVERFQVDSTADVFRYMLAWLLITAFFKDVTLAIKNDYLNEVLEGKDFQTLLYYIFDHVDLDNKFLTTLSIDDVLEYQVNEVLKARDLNEELKLLSLHIYYKCLKYCGFQVQLWFREIKDKQLQMKVERITSKYLSPPLIKEILEQVEKDKQKLLQKEDNLSIKVNRNEIKTSYLVDDQKLEMVVKVPTHYPLENVIIDGPARVGVKESRWKAWLLASQKLISLQNGSISDAIELFCKNINLHFSGFEDCAICYSILHQDLSLPSKTCQTCNNKFHAACLYKWFKSSGNSTCPLCRSPFNFKTRS